MPAAKKSTGKPPSRFSQKSAGRPSATPAVKAAVKKSKQPEREDAFHSLRAMLAEFAPLFDVATDTAARYTLVTRGHVWRGGPMFFAEVRAGKVYASFHIMALYLEPSLEAVSPQLARRKQGKTCFNFNKTVPPDLLDELREVTRRGIQLYTDRYPGWQKPDA
jgi:hypothetical protein